MENKTNSKAIWGFIISIIGLFIFGIILGIIAFIMGDNAINEIKETHENGIGLAKASKILGVIDIIGGAISAMLLFI